MPKTKTKPAAHQEKSEPSAAKTEKLPEPTSMAEAARLYGNNLIPFHINDVMEVTVLQKTRNRILVDVSGYNTGFVPEKEFSFDANDLKVGDKVLASILSLENDSGYVVLSLRRADRERIWQTLQENFDSGEPVKARVKAANRGGLMVEFGGQEGFLPVSQLSAANYPKVEGGDTAQILAKLKPMIGQLLDVKIITFDRPTNRLIFSEKAIEQDRMAGVASKFKVGQEITCSISGVVDFGLFVKVPVDNESVEGLIHISEISWERVTNLQERFSIGQEIKAQVISIEKGKLSLSLKRLEKDPWESLEKSYKPGEKVIGEVTNLTPFGAFVRLPNGLDALLHISQMEKDAKLKEGQSYDFYILSIDTKVRKINLSMSVEKKPAKAKKKKS